MTVTPSVSGAEPPTAVVLRFCEAWSRLDLDELAAFFTEDAVYHNIPLDPVVGRGAIRSTIAGFTDGVESVTFEVRHVLGDGRLVMTERVDHFRLPGKVVSLPVMGAFEVDGGRIAAWRDYFDMNQFVSQLGS